MKADKTPYQLVRHRAKRSSRLRNLNVRGLYTVELAIVAPLAFTLLFGVIEAGRAMFVYNTLEEVTRRGARLAAVCQLNDAAIARRALLGGAGGGDSSPVVAGLGSANIRIQYLNINGVPIANPGGNFAQIEFVRVSLQDFTHELLIPFLTPTFQSFFVPEFSTTLPRESLGVTRDGLQTC